MAKFSMHRCAYNTIRLIRHNGTNSWATSLARHSREPVRMSDENREDIPTVTLSNGLNMPMLGLGTWQSQKGEVGNAVKTAIKLGYRLIDGAYGYGNEAEVGAAVKEVIAEGVVKREELFITSKLWNTRHTPSDVRPSVEESLSLLGLDYIDMYLIHWPHAFKPGKDNFPKDDQGNLLYVDIHYLDTWKALEKCCDEGLVKAIGVSNFNSIQLQDILDNCRVKPVNLQVEIHPYFPQDKLVKFAQERGVTVTGYSPFGSPARPWVTKDDASLLDDPDLKKVAQRLGKSPAQVILRWFLQRNVTVIPKSVTPSRIAENLDVFNFVLTQEDMDVIKTFDRNCRLICPMVEKDGKRVYRDGAAPYYPFQEDIEF